MFDVKEEYTSLVNIAERTGSQPHSFGADDVAYVVVHANQILKSHEIPGVEISATETEFGIRAFITVKEGAIVPKPVHLCFGHLGSNGRQVIETHVKIEPHAKAVFQAHCIFPNAVEFSHEMEGEIEVGEGATFTYNEIHVHGPEGKILVKPKTRVVIQDKGRYNSDFTLVEGRVGKLDLDIDVEAKGEKSRVEITSKIYGKKDDDCRIKDIVRLTGREASALIKARVVLKDESHGHFLGLADGAAPGAKGHVDCTEIVQGKAVAESSPTVKASHPEAEVTHEAAIGRIADEKISGLMAKGLTQDEAVDVIVAGLLR